MTRKEYSKTTIKLREVHLNRLVRLNADLDNPESVETVLALSNWGKAYKRIIVGCYKAYCKWREIFWEAPRIHVPQKIEKLPTEEDVKILIAGLGKRTATLCQVLYETGCRIGEGCKLRWNDVDWKRQRININAPEKRGNSRAVNASVKLLSMLKALPKRSDGYIFNPKPRSHDSCFNVSRNRLAKKLQKPELKEIHFHTFRHLRATIELYTKGKHHRDVQYMLGHRSSQSTDRYTHYRPQAPTKWETRRVKTRAEEDQLIEENWILHRYDSVHQEVIYRRAKLG
jgi:integrase